MSLTKMQMIEMGMTAEQIEAVLGSQEIEEEVKENEEVKTNVVPIQTAYRNVEYTESDITSLTDIVKYAGGTIVRLPDFGEGAPFIAKLKRPSMLGLVKAGKIPNSLITQATQLFKSGAGSLGKGSTIDELYDIIEVVCKEAMVKPTYDEIKNAGVNLSDDQLMAIFSYTQSGVKALESFR